MEVITISRVIFVSIAFFVTIVDSVEPELTKCKSREVQVVTQIPNLVNFEDDLWTHIHVQQFIKKLHNIPRRCFNLKTTVIDSVAIDVGDDGNWAQITGHTPEASLKNHLTSLAKEHGERYEPDAPKGLVVLVVGDTPSDLPSLFDAAKGLMEYAKFVIVSVDLFDINDRGEDDYKGSYREGFEKITQSPDRYFAISNFEGLQAPLIFDRLINLFENPSYVEPKPEIGLLFSTQPSVENVIDTYKDSTQSCVKHVDIAFLMDGSGSVKMNYIEEQKFVIGLAKAFGISESTSHAGVIQFSKKAKLTMKLNGPQDLDSFASGVMDIKPQRLTTYIDRALVIARDEFFTVENGGRPGLKKLVVLITDGNQTKTHAYTPPEEIAEEIRNQGIHILAIGIGETVDVVEMSKIVGPNDNWRQVRTFNQLASKTFVDTITKKGCEIDEVKTPECEKLVDLVFMLDASGSIDEHNDFTKMKEFVITIANAFGLSDSGAHAGLVVFSDYVKPEKGRYYSNIFIKLNENTTMSSFRGAVQNAKYYGHRTRIDEGFRLVKQVLEPTNGARPNVKKVVILITDGRQNPTGADMDPVKESEALINDGVHIYAIGIGRTISKDQLHAITRKEHRVFYADNFESLASVEFVKNVSKTACRNGSLPGPTGMPFTPPCAPKACTGCCGGCPVFNNIFNLNLGPTYVVSGAQISKDGKSLSGDCASERCKTYPMNNMNIEQLMQVIKTAVDGMCKGKCQNTVQAGKRGPPAVVTGRKRRSIDSDPELEKLSIMRSLSRTAGCNMFIQSLKKNGLMERIHKLMKTGHHVAIFCPVDTAYTRIFESKTFSEIEEQILLNHIGIKHDKFSTMYHTLAGGKIVFNAVGKHQGASKWRANGADVIISIQDGVNSEIVILNGIILPKSQMGILGALKKNPDVSIFYNLLTAVGYESVFSPASTIEKVCFTNNTCVSLTPAMVNHFKDAIEFNHFTVVAPTNTMFRTFYKDVWQMSRRMRSKLVSSDQLKEFLRRHVYIGTLGNPDSRKEIAYSLSAQHSIMTTKTEKTATGKMITMLVDSQGNELPLSSTVDVKEGTLLVVGAAQAA